MLNGRQSTSSPSCLRISSDHGTGLMFSKSGGMRLNVDKGGMARPIPNRSEESKGKKEIS